MTSPTRRSPRSLARSAAAGSGRRRRSGSARCSARSATKASRSTSGRSPSRPMRSCGRSSSRSPASDRRPRPACSSFPSIVPTSRSTRTYIASRGGSVWCRRAPMPSPRRRRSRRASHREAPLISLDPAADITDFFMFRNYETTSSNKVDLIMNVIPGEEPSSGPNYFLFDPNVLYAFNIDNDMDGVADDVIIEFRFSTEIRGTVKDLDLFLDYVALPPITHLDGMGSEGLGVRQHYTVTMVKKGKREELASGLIAVPSRVGPRTMPDYDSLAMQGTYELGNGIKVFAGQRDDPFYIDLGAVFDTLNLRRAIPAETPAEDANDNANPFGTDQLSGFNVNTIAIELPAEMLTTDGKGADMTTQPKLGGYASTSRRKERVLIRVGKGEPRDPDLRKTSGPWVQVQRRAKPLINETIIGSADKDEWNARDPE